MLNTDKVLSYTLSAFGASILFVVGGYITHVNQAIAANDKKITDAAVELMHTEEGLGVVNAKLDMVLRAEHLQYFGPPYHTYTDRHKQLEDPPR